MSSGGVLVVKGALGMVRRLFGLSRSFASQIISFGPSLKTGKYALVLTLLMGVYDRKIASIASI